MTFIFQAFGKFSLLALRYMIQRAVSPPPIRLTIPRAIPLCPIRWFSSFFVQLFFLLFHPLLPFKYFIYFPLRYSLLSFLFQRWSLPLHTSWKYSFHLSIIVCSSFSSVPSLLLILISLENFWLIIVLRVL